MSRAELDPNDAANKPAEIEPLAPRARCCSISRIAGSRLVAVGERGHVLLSDDQGATWRQAKSVPTRAMLTAVFFADSEYGWAVGHDETILNTVDGGETWTRSHFAPEAQQPLLDLWFANRVSGIAVGAYGAYFTTNDGGRHLGQRQVRAAAAPKAHADGEAAPDDESPPDYHLNRIVGVGNRLYIAAEGGQLYRSDDRGANWRALPSPYEGSFFGLVPIRGEGLLAFGLRGHLYPLGRCRRDLDTARIAHHRHADRWRGHQRSARGDRRTRRRAAGVGGCRRDLPSHAAGRSQGHIGAAAGPGGRGGGGRRGRRAHDLRLDAAPEDWP